MERNIILTIGWLILIFFSIYIYIRGIKVYSLVKGSLIGKITKTLVLSLLLEIYSIGVLSTAYILVEKKSIYLVSLIFVILLLVIFATIRMISLAREETRKLIEKDK
jgi:hypothetical protein